MRRTTGTTFERLAGQALERAGLKLLMRNYTTRYGELDLVMRDGHTVVFVEVRYRRYADHGDARASITCAKRDRLIRAAQLWLTAHPDQARQPCRFDVISYDGPATHPRMHWLRDAFDAL